MATIHWMHANVLYNSMSKYAFCAPSASNIHFLRRLPLESIPIVTSMDAVAKSSTTAPCAIRNHFNCCTSTAHSFWHPSHISCSWHSAGHASNFHFGVFFASWLSLPYAQVHPVCHRSQLPSAFITICWVINPFAHIQTHNRHEGGATQRYINRSIRVILTLAADTECEDDLFPIPLAVRIWSLHWSVAFACEYLVTQFRPTQTVCTHTGSIIAARIRLTQTPHGYSSPPVHSYPRKICPVSFQN